MILPILGILIYKTTRPKPTEEEQAELCAYAAPAPLHSLVDEVSKLVALHEKGAVSDEEYERLKSKAVA